MSDNVKVGITELRKWWSFDENQHHAHSWHDREDYIEQVFRPLGEELEELRGMVHYCPQCGASCKECECTEKLIAERKALNRDPKPYTATKPYTAPAKPPGEGPAVRYEAAEAAKGTT
jgi:hypothetical protein